MLDYFILKGFVKLNEDGSVERTAACPKDLVFKEDQNGVIKFYFKSSQAVMGQSVYFHYPINDIEAFETIFEKSWWHTANKDGATQVNNTI